MEPVVITLNNARYRVVRGGCKECAFDTSRFPMDTQVYQKRAALCRTSPTCHSFQERGLLYRASVAFQELDAAPQRELHEDEGG